MKTDIAIVGLAVGVVGLLVALILRARWARPLGALLLAGAVVAEIMALQSHTGARAAGGDGPKLTPIPTGLPTTTKPSSSPTPTASASVVFHPHLLSQIHPGVEPIFKAVTVNKEFVRLVNAGTLPRHITGWTLSNGTVTYTFPDVIIPPHESILVRSGPGTNSTTVLHWNLSSYVWPRLGGHVFLRDGQGRLINQCIYHISQEQIDAGHPSASC